MSACCSRTAKKFFDNGQTASIGGETWGYMLLFSVLAVGAVQYRVTSGGEVARGRLTTLTWPSHLQSWHIVQSSAPRRIGVEDSSSNQAKCDLSLG